MISAEKLAEVLAKHNADRGPLNLGDFIVFTQEGEAWTYVCTGIGTGRWTEGYQTNPEPVFTHYEKPVPCTVQMLIEMLMKIEDKTQEVSFDGEFYDHEPKTVSVTQEKGYVSVNI